MRNKQHTFFGYKILAATFVVVAITHVFIARGSDDPFFSPPVPQQQDTSDSEQDSMPFPLEDERYAGPGEGRKQPIDLQDPANKHQEVYYDAEQDRYYIYEKVGDRDVRHPTYLNADEYEKFRAAQEENAYWKQRLDALTMFNQKPTLPEMKKEGIFDRLFGGNTISVKPQGNLDLTFGGSWQNMKNPDVVQSAQKYGIFDFDMTMNVNLVAQIGEKLKLNISQNTLPTFGQENTQKIEYTGKEDEIIKKIEAGSVDFPLNSSLLSGPLSLFGLKAQLQFGKLFVTGVISQQKSQRKSVSVQGGAQTQEFEIKIDDYEENRNFLLGQYFYENYEEALQDFPLIRSQINLTEVEVWITNRTGVTEGVRDILSFMDLGEKTPYLPTLTDAGTLPYPDNRVNRLYEMLMRNPGARSQSTSTQTVMGMGLTDGQDFQRSTMRKLNPSEFTFNNQLGFISLNTTINPDDVLAVAYRYTLNGKIYQVGEFASDFPPDSTNQKVMFLKLLKGTSARANLPIWDLMMKNVYSIGAVGGISAEDFRLNVVYQDPGGGEKRYLPDGPSAGIPLITLLNLDRLNRQNDPGPDGVFDYVEGITIDSRGGKVIFPVLEPFGSSLKPAMGGDPQLEKRYLFQMLYDSTKAVARQFQQNNRFLIKGSFKGSSGGSDIYLGGYNIPEGSVTVTAGGQRLTENVDYQVDYSRGSVNIINQGILNSGVPINISYEDNANFGLVNQSFWGARLDYFANDKLTLGGTVMQLSERPFSQKVLYGDDPIKNLVAGLDANYQSESQWMTRMLDKIPLYSSNTPSLVSLSGEVAGIFPGHHRFINGTDPEGSVSIDDFEGANSFIDLRFPPSSWSLASTPQDAKDENGNILFPEAQNADLSNGRNRAKLSWYMLEPTLVDGYSGTPESIKNDTAFQDYWRLVQQDELFPQRTTLAVQSNLTTFDLLFRPYERGPYNFETEGLDINTGNFNRSTVQQRWGGIQRAIDNNNSDFEASNVEYITFWLLDPFIYQMGGQQSGDLYINLGDVSEDVLKDSRLAFENGTPYPKDLSKLDATPWGYVPKFQQQITRSFDNDPNARSVQDVGLNALNDDEETDFYADFLQQVQAVLPPEAYERLLTDPASDNFLHYRDESYDQAEAGALERYTHYNSPQGNSPVSSLNQEYVSSGTSIPESEDLNRDNTLNENEAYYQYRIHLRKDMPVGSEFVNDKKTITVELQDGRPSTQTWYQFKIPIRSYDQAVGGISDFRSIRFMRMFLNGFDDSMVVLRFAQLQLDRNTWRRYQFSLTEPGEQIPEEDQQTTSFALTTVGLEENYVRQPIPYRMPPGIERQYNPGGITGQNMAEDEQSMALQICGLKDGDARAVFKEQRMDMRQFKSLRMFVHAESVPDQAPLNDGELEAFIRIGSDFTNNYYEYRIPLQVSLTGNADPNQIWPEANRMDVLMQDFIDAKIRRNEEGQPAFLPYRMELPGGKVIVVVGNPNFGDVKNIMMGVANPKKTLQTPGDDGLRKCAEIWFDEFRMAGMEERPGYAASGQANLQLADLGNLHFGGTMHTAGYGAIDQKVNERFQDDFYSYDVSGNLNMGKLLPKTWGLQLPVYAAYSEMVSNPRYNPYDKDVLLNTQMQKIRDAAMRDSLRKAAQDFTSITSFNLSNVRFLGNPEKQGKVTMPWSLKNFDLSYIFNRTFNRDPLLEFDELTEQRLTLGYNYSLRVKYFEPFKKAIKSRSKWWNIIKDFNIGYMPSSFSFRNDLHRILGETRVRNVDGGPYQLPPTFYKNFVWDRTYNMSWELSKGLAFSYTANNQSRIDEPEGRIDTKEKRDSLWNNLSDFGRNTYFNQSLNVTYTLPTRKLPILDWTNITANFTSNYTWTAASRLAADLGNVMANNQTKQINGEFNFTQLYNKSRWLRAINAPPPRVQPVARMNGRGSDSSGKNNLELKSGEKEVVKPKITLPPRPEKKKIAKSEVPDQDSLSSGEIRKAWRKLKRAERKRFRKEIASWRARRNRILPEVSGGLKAAGRLLTMLKRVNVNYTESAGTVLPGFMDSTQFLGVNSRSEDQWYDFAFGYQPDRAWLDRLAVQDRISRSLIFNGQLQQTYSQNYSITATVEPAPDLRVDFNWNKQFTKNFSETFKFDETVQDYQHFSPYSMGTFNITYIGLTTLFTATPKNSPSELFQQFLTNRTEISRRLGAINPYTQGLPDPSDPEYAKGYTRYAQNVLIPAFLAAYTGRNARDIPLMTGADVNVRSNPFKGYMPLPNWKLTYNGLAKLEVFRSKVSNFVLNHAYMGNMSMNSFISSFYYEDLLNMGFPSFIDSNSQNYVPFFTVPNVTISENLSPIVGMDIAFHSGLNLSIQFNKSRMLSLSLVDFQVSETKSTEVILGGGHRIQGLHLPFSIFGIESLENDINIRMDVGFRNDITTNSYLADQTVVATRGQQVLTIAPSVDYVINENLQVRLFFDRRQSIPALTTSYPINTTRAGLTLRFLFAPQ